MKELESQKNHKLCDSIYTKSGISKSIDSRLVIRGVGEEEMESGQSRVYRVSFGGDKSILNLDFSDCCTSLNMYIYLKKFHSYTLN